MPSNPRKRRILSLLFVAFVVSLLCRSKVKAAETERDQAVEAIGQLASKTDSLEEQLETLGRLLEEARERVSEKAQQLQHAEVGTVFRSVRTWVNTRVARTYLPRLFKGGFMCSWYHTVSGPFFPAHPFFQAACDYHNPH